MLTYPSSPTEEIVLYPLYQLTCPVGTCLFPTNLSLNKFLEIFDFFNKKKTVSRVKKFRTFFFQASGYQFVGNLLFRILFCHRGLKMSTFFLSPRPGREIVLCPLYPLTCLYRDLSPTSEFAAETVS